MLPFHHMPDSCHLKDNKSAIKHTLFVEEAITKLLKEKCIEEVYSKPYCITHICRIKGCGGAGWPPQPIIFERLKLPQQIIYRRKENLSESPNHQKYWENILVSRFYEQFSRNRRNLGHFRKFEKISNS